MTDTGKQGFHTVEANVEEMKQKIRKHRRRIAIGIAVAAIITAISMTAAGLYFTYKEYKQYSVLSETERSDSGATQYESFSGNILRYNNDGAFYTDMDDKMIWNQAFEMQNPHAEVCENYAVIADMQGKQIYIMNTVGIQGEITTHKPIYAACVAAQGTIAVLTQENGTSYIELYNKSGESLASGGIHAANSGHPLDIALSNDAKKLAVSILDFGSGRAKTTIAFYNFGSVGQNKIDNIVGSYGYDNVVIPEIAFVSNDRMISFGDNQIVFFEGKQSPEPVNELKLENKIKSIFYDLEYFGIVYDNGDAAGSHKMDIYDMQGDLRLEKEFKMDYRAIEFLANHEICIRNDYECKIFTLRGVEKFEYRFDNVLYKIFSGGMRTRYTFIFDGVIEKIKLK